MNNNEFRWGIDEDRRSYFRIDDRIPLTVRVVRDDRTSPARIITPEPADSNAAMPDDTGGFDDRVAEMLYRIDRKLDFIMNALILQQEGLPLRAQHDVNLSAAGMRLQLEEKIEEGDIVEVKMVLPLCPSVGLSIYGRVVRVSEKAGSGRHRYEAAIDFIDVGQDVKDRIIEYTLMRQREIIRREKGCPDD